ncbi:MAG: YeeE/YedE family protein, partial [Lysobacterales bacterium]
MSTFPAPAVLVIACLCAGLMGYAIQRGATCTVAAVDELLHEHRGTRLLAIVEAALWVLGGLLLARAAGLPVPMPAGYAAGMTTVLGAGLLGAGA